MRGRAPTTKPGPLVGRRMGSSSDQRNAAVQRRKQNFAALASNGMGSESNSDGYDRRSSETEDGVVALSMLTLKTEWAQTARLHFQQLATNYGIDWMATTLGTPPPAKAKTGPLVGRRMGPSSDQQNAAVRRRTCNFAALASKGMGSESDSGGHGESRSDAEDEAVALSMLALKIARAQTARLHLQRLAANCGMDCMATTHGTPLPAKAKTGPLVRRRVGPSSDQRNAAVRPCKHNFAALSSNGMGSESDSNGHDDLDPPPQHAAAHAS